MNEVTGPHSNTWASKHPVAFRRLWQYSLLLLLTLAGVIALRQAAESRQTQAEPPRASDGTHGTNVAPIAASDAPDPCGLKDVVCPGESTYNHPTGDDTGPYWVTATAFSSVECHTAWCEANAGKQAGHQVALSSGFGNRGEICQVIVYRPDLSDYPNGQIYDVIGYTDPNTQLDFWFGDDHQGAVNFGRQDVRVDLVACPS